MTEPSHGPDVVEVCVCQDPATFELDPDFNSFNRLFGSVHLSQRLRMLSVLEQSLRHIPYVLVARRQGRIVGYLGVAHVKSLIFGRFLVSLPYVNTAGVIAEDSDVAYQLVDCAVKLADRLAVRYLELRHEKPIVHPALATALTSKVHMRLELPEDVDRLWDQLKSKVRNLVRKGRSHGLSVSWGREESLPDFYRVFSANMRDLGTPVYSPRLFSSLLRHFEDRAEICIVRDGTRVLAAALLLHGDGITEVPSASSLRRYNSTNANMLMYWHLLARAVERGQARFDFGRSSVNSNTYRFKEQWGAVAAPAVWQYYLRDQASQPMRPENEGFRALVSIWRRLPVRIANTLGPAIVRGIP